MGYQVPRACQRYRAVVRQLDVHRKYDLRPGGIFPGGIHRSPDQGVFAFTLHHKLLPIDKKGHREFQGKAAGPVYEIVGGTVLHGHPHHQVGHVGACLELLFGGGFREDQLILAGIRQQPQQAHSKYRGPIEAIRCSHPDLRCLHIPSFALHKFLERFPGSCRAGQGSSILAKRPQNQVKRSLRIFFQPSEISLKQQPFTSPDAPLPFQNDE